MTTTAHEWEISRHGHPLAILSDEDTMRRNLADITKRTRATMGPNVPIKVRHRTVTRTYSEWEDVQ